LLDVAEHIKPSKRKLFFKKIADLSNSGSVLIVSLPHVKNRPTSIINNRIRRSITQHLPYFLKREEHPYPIPKKWDILNMTVRNFSLLKFIESADTDYYVFHRY